MSQAQPNGNDFVISVAGSNIDLSIINIEEMNEYCKSRGRLANVVTEKQTYHQLDKMNYSLIMNYTKPKPRVINTKDKLYFDVYNILSEKYKGGLLIIEADTISDPVSELLCNSDNWKKNDIDLMICRTGFSSVTKNELKKANLLRISADPEFDPAFFLTIDDDFKEKILPLMISQLFVNAQYDSVNRYIESKHSYFNEKGITDYIDYYELNKQLAFFIYYDILANKILNVDRATITAFIVEVGPQMSIPSEQIPMIAEMITL
jgi:hypothetical protein